jgi:antitoxin (DNA-binding transcriptional repressor) of toxin-antitoxin stability system
MTSVGIRELKNNLSAYVQEVQRGTRIAVTAHGRVVAELGPPATHRKPKPVKKLSRWEQMVADGHILLPTDTGDPFDGVDPEPLVPPGSSQAWLDWSREDK